MQPSTLKPSGSSKEIVIAPVLKLEQDLDAARKTATDALLEERRCIDAALQKIGYQSDSFPTEKRNGARRVCTVCGETGHNARKHKDVAVTTISSH